MTLRVVLVDDEPLIRSGLRAIINAEPDLDVIGEAEDGAGALLAVQRLAPQVVLLDVQLPDIDGFEVAARLTANGDSPAIVLTSSRDVNDLGPLREREGVRGFIPKSELSGAALEALL